MSQQQIESQEPFPFIPRALDEAGLSPTQFRVLCHIARRMGKRTGYCDESADNQAKECGLSGDTVTEALDFLVKYRFLGECERVGRTTVYTLRPQFEWMSLPPRPPRKKKGGSNAVNPGENSPGDSLEKTPPLPPEKRGGHPPEKTPPKGSPSNGYPSKEQSEGGKTAPRHADAKGTAKAIKFDSEKRQLIKELEAERWDIVSKQSANCYKYRDLNEKLTPKWKEHAGKLSVRIAELNAELRGFSRPDDSIPELQAAPATRNMI